MTKYEQTMRIIRSIRKQSGTAVLFYSAGGKDSIALLDMLAKEFDKVICVFMYLVDGLEHQELYNDWAVKKYSNVEIRRIPHIQVGIIKANGFFCDVDDQAEQIKIGELEQKVLRMTNQKFAFSGMKGVDGFMKRMRLKMFGENFTSPKGMVYPLAIWTNAEVLKYIQSKNLIKPFVYLHPNAISQGCGLDIDTLLCLKQRYPKDYEKIKQEFPYVGAIEFKHEQSKANGSS